MIHTAQLRSIATAHPPTRLTREDWLAIAGEISPASVDRAILARLADRSGIDARWCAVLEGGRNAFYRAGEVPGTAERMQLWLRAAKAMAVEAGTRALADAGIAPAAVTHVVTASCTGFAAPSVDAHLIESLGLARDVQRLNVGFMGCHAAVNALAAARNAVLADPRAVVLVCCTEVSSAHFHHTARLDQLIANTLFADGAGVAVVAAGEAAGGTAGDTPAILGTHSVLIPDTANEMGWMVGDRGFEMTLGARVPEVLEREVGAWVRGALAEHGIALSEVGAWAIHPGGPRVIDAVSTALALTPEAGAPSRTILREYGNMSSATLLFIINRLRAAGAPRPWVGLAFGPGLVGEMVVVR
jgi:predicted naringenin-chalcone synthase